MEDNKIICFKGVKEESLMQIKSMMEKSFLSFIPYDYLNFLKVSDGFLLKDVIFYGTIERKRINYNLPSVFEINKMLEKNNISEKFIIGKFLDMFIMFNNSNLK